MGRSTYTLDDFYEEFAAGQRAFEARNAEIEERTARELARVEREHAEKKAALKAARENRDAEAAAAAGRGPIQVPAPGQVMPVAHAAAAPCPPPAHMLHVPPQGPVPVYYVPVHGQVQVPMQQQIQTPLPFPGPVPAPAQPRIRRSPAETMRDLRLAAICKRRVDDGARTQRINQAEKAGVPATQEPPLPDEEWYLTEELKRAVEREDITWKEIKKLRREEEGGCCVLM